MEDSLFIFHSFTADLYKDRMDSPYKDSSLGVQREQVDSDWGALNSLALKDAEEETGT